VTRADQHCINLHLTMMLMHARTLPKRTERVKYMSGQRFRGPHGWLTGDVVEVTREDAEHAADLIEAEEAKGAAS
jgi:hypothetical protein